MTYAICRYVRLTPGGIIFPNLALTESGFVKWGSNGCIEVNANLSTQP